MNLKLQLQTWLICCLNLVSDIDLFVLDYCPIDCPCMNNTPYNYIIIPSSYCLSCLSEVKDPRSFLSPVAYTGRRCFDARDRSIGSKFCASNCVSHLAVVYSSGVQVDRFDYLRPYAVRAIIFIFISSNTLHFYSNFIMSNGKISTYIVNCLTILY